MTPPLNPTLGLAPTSHPHDPMTMMMMMIPLPPCLPPHLCEPMTPRPPCLPPHLAHELSHLIVIEYVALLPQPRRQLRKADGPALIRVQLAKQVLEGAGGGGIAVEGGVGTMMIAMMMTMMMIPMRRAAAGRSSPPSFPFRRTHQKYREPNVENGSIPLLLLLPEHP